MYQLIKLYFRLFFKNNKGLLIILILLFTSFSTLYINLHQTKINRDTTTQIYDQYIDKYSGIPNNSKEKQILKELDSYENNEDILKEYQNHQITQKEYLKKQRKNNSNILKKDALNSFYLYYLKIKNTQNKEIANTKYTDCLNFNNLDFIIILVLFFLIYSIYLKEIDDHIWIYEKTTSNGIKNAKKSKIFVFSCIWGLFLILMTIGKILIFKHFSRLDFSIINIPWCSKNCPNISLITFICFCTFLYYIASYLLCGLSILLKKFIHSNIFILLVLFIFVYIPLAFLGNSIHILYFPFISFLVPGRYFAGYGEKMLGIDFHIVIIELIIIFIFFLLSFFKGKRKNLIFLSLLILITGCSNNQNNSSSFQYNSYHELNFAENKEYYYFSNKIIDKNDWKEYSLVRNLYESSNNLINVFPQKDGFFYTIDDDESEYLYLFNNDFQDVKLKKLSSLQKNFMNIEQQHIPISDKNILGIIGNKNRYYIIYSDKITNQNNKVVYKGKLTNRYSIYHQYLYFLQDDYTIIKISLDTFKKEKLDTPLCDYFYIKNNHLYLHNIQDDKLYCDNQILFNEQIENSDIYKDKLYYTRNDGLFMYDFTYKESTLLTKEKVYSLKISIDGKYLSYITDSTKKNKEIKIIIKDLKKNKIVYVRDA